MEVNRFTEENNRLAHNVDSLEGEVNRVQHVENELTEMAKESKNNVDDLVTIVKENQTVVKRQAKLARAAFQEQLLTTVLRTDRDQNMRLEANEVDILIMRMRSQEGIMLDERMFRERIERNNGSLWTVLEVLRELGEDDADLGGSGDEDDGVGSVSVESGTGSRMSTGTGRYSTASKESVVSVNNRKLLSAIRESDREMDGSSSAVSGDGSESKPHGTGPTENF